jgi:hypothetical protein
MIDGLILEGDAYEFRRELKEGKPDWEMASIFGPNGGLLFALDTGYRADLDKKEFVFEPNRSGEFRFELPRYLQQPADVFRIDSDGVHDCESSVDGRSLTIRDRVSVVGIYVVAGDPGAREKIRGRHAALLEKESRIGFDPANDAGDLAELRGLLE